jgi:hypothetical protein
MQEWPSVADTCIVGDRGQKIDPKAGRVVATIPGRDSGLAWAEGTLWVGQYRE